MNWIDAVKELNKIKGHKNWVVPRKGTKSYKLAVEMTKTKKPVTRKPMMTTKIMALKKFKKVSRKLFSIIYILFLE